MKKCRFVTLRMLAISLLLQALVACGGDENPKLTVEERYQLAIQDAQVAEPNEIRRNLVPIVETNNDLIWQEEAGRRRVLMSTWTSWDGYRGYEGTDIDLTREVWVTPAPFVQNFCRNAKMSGQDLVLRMEQLLGLPPNDGKTIFVEMWVSPADLFRPAPDSEITDTEAQLDFPAGTSAEYIDWFNNLMATSYGNDGYPWTRLGYTYDWAADSDEEGVSEYVIRSGASVGIASVSDTFSYCAVAP